MYSQAHIVSKYHRCQEHELLTLFSPLQKKNAKKAQNYLYRCLVLVIKYSTKV